MKRKNLPFALMGHGLLVVAFLLLFWFPALWEALGVGALMLWMVVAAAGVYCLLQQDEPPLPPSQL